jgi:tetratricopeptide (TPR) repeat protein
MYDHYPAYEVPQNNIVQRFFAQRWSAILLEIALTIVITVAAGQAFEFFDPFDGEAADAAPIAASAPAVDADAMSAALAPVKQRGADYVAERRFVAAEALYDFALALEPDDPGNLGWRGYVNLQTGDYLDAQADFRRVLDLSPLDYDAHNALCWAYGESQDFTSAMEHCGQALIAATSLPQYAIALENRCWLQVEMGEYEAAEQECLAVLRIYPGCQQEVCALAHYNLGRIKLAQGKSEAALRQFNLAFRIGATYADMYLEIGQVYDRLGFGAAAKTSFAKYDELAGARVSGR